MAAEQNSQININQQIEAKTAIKVVDLLAEHTGLPKSRIKDAMQKGAVWISRDKRGTKRIRRGSTLLKSGDKIGIYYNTDLLNSLPPPPSLIVDQTEYSVWFKPSGLMSSGSRYGDHFAISRWVELHLARPTFHVHRLDRFTQGVMVLAHSKKVAADLAQQFRERSTFKEYRAEVVGRLAEEVTVSKQVDGKDAISHVSPIERKTQSTVVKVVIKTGRKHQIREHLASLGHPILGDRLHGGGAVEDLQLSATAIGFYCPLQEKFVEYRHSCAPS